MASGISKQASKGRAYLEDVMRRTQPAIDMGDRYEALEDLERIALEYVNEPDDAGTAVDEVVRETLHAAAAQVLGESRLPRSEGEAKSRLVAAIRSVGSERVLVQACEKHLSGWKAYVLAIIPWSPDFAEDIVQGAVTATLQARPHFKALAAVDAYVREAIRSTLRDFRSGQKPSQLSIDDEDPAIPALAAGGPSPRRSAWHHERANLLQAVFRGAPPEEQEAFLLYELAKKPKKKWTLEEIAKLQGVSVQTVANRVARLRARLQAAFGEW